VKLATLCYVRRGGKTLMIHRIKKANDIHEGKWNGLGGKLEAGETPEECAAREVLEEAGLIVHAPQLKGLLTFPNFANNEDWYAFVFVITQFEGELIDSPEGELAWIPNEQIESLNLWAGDRVFLPWLDQPGFFSGKFIYQDGEFIEHQVMFHSG
jgi:8-oxo-dGTP diphosphatase